MRITPARIKVQKDFPPIELCCAEVITMQTPYYGMRIFVDLDDTKPYEGIVGHCGQQLPYDKSVQVVTASGEPQGYTPFGLIYIQEGADA